MFCVRQASRWLPTQVGDITFPGGAPAPPTPRPSWGGSAPPDPPDPAPPAPMGLPNMGAKAAALPFPPRPHWRRRRRVRGLWGGGAPPGRPGGLGGGSPPGRPISQTCSPTTAMSPLRKGSVSELIIEIHIHVMYVVLDVNDNMMITAQHAYETPTAYAHHTCQHQI